MKEGRLKRAEESQLALQRAEAAPPAAVKRQLRPDLQGEVESSVPRLHQKELSHLSELDSCQLAEELAEAGYLSVATSSVPGKSDFAPPDKEASREAEGLRELSRHLEAADRQEREQHRSAEKAAAPSAPPVEPIRQQGRKAGESSELAAYPLRRTEWNTDSSQFPWDLRHID